MLFGRPLRCDTSRSGSASPDDRNAARMRDECTTDLTRYGSRGSVGVRGFMCVAFERCRRCEEQNIAVLYSSAGWARSLEQTGCFVLFFCRLAVALGLAPPFHSAKPDANAGKPLTARHRGLTTSSISDVSAQWLKEEGM